MLLLIERMLGRPRTVLVAWAVAIAVAGVFALRLGGVVQGGADTIPGSDSDLVGKALERSFGRGTAYLFVVVMQDTTITTDDPLYGEVVERVSDSLSSLPAVQSVETAWNSPRWELVAKDWHTSLALVTPRVDSYYEAERLTSDLRRAIKAARPPPSFSVYVTGATAMLHDLDEESSSDLFAAERIGLPITLVILLVVFGAPLAALLPVVLAIAAVTIGLAGIYAVSPWTPASVFAENVVSMIGLGVGVDYALFVLSRFREEMARGSTPAGAAAAAVRAAGHSVVFSGATVTVGFLALLLVRAPFLHTIALGGLFVVLAAVAAAMTLLPALLIIFGAAINWPRRAPTARAETDRQTAFWTRWAETVMKRPWAFLIPAAIILIVLILPVFRLQAWNIGAPHLSRDAESRRGFEVLATEFPQGWMGPVIGLIEARPGVTVWQAESRHAVIAMANELGADPRSGQILGLPQLIAALGPLSGSEASAKDLREDLQPAVRQVVSEDGRVALVALVTPKLPGDPETMRYVRELRHRAWPGLEAAGLSVRWSGSTAVMADFDDELFQSLRKIVVTVVVLTFAVLALLFRSLVIPLKATVLNVLSVLATYGFLVLVFQDGLGARWIGLDPPGGLNSFIVLMLFTILFGLSMDYEVFLLSRVREEYQASGDNARAVAAGLGRTAGIITSAALIMISIFAAFGFTRLIPTREFGLGLAFAVALDATIIRIVLVPALMVISGRWNWWWPWRRT